MKKIIVSLLLAFALAPAGAQIVVPDYNFETREDYTHFNDAILECCNWLMSTPLNEMLNEIDQVIPFVSAWSMGSPDVMILVHPELMPYINSNPLFLTWHFAGASKYQLERGMYANTKQEITDSSLAGINAVLDFYENNGELLRKDKDTEKLCKIRNKGKLERFVTKVVDKMPDEEVEKIGRHTVDEDE